MMTPKNKAFFLNFVCFALIFMLLRTGLVYFFPQLSYVWFGLISGIVSVFVSPRFSAVHTEKGEKIFMKWLFSKEIKQIGK
ncbi:hypothetical protein [Capnocytophaga sp.]|uniref:hypothetical protein n=1 Tax=Capnocytophaga sp. TaxID=44737 RepID=UPI0026DC95FC|nr:hypothetical protein [Capnocytophaga sp.]MDO5105913.1 hypothetical protein [Capnocytophaga sp.]